MIIQQSLESEILPLLQIQNQEQNEIPIIENTTIKILPMPQFNLQSEFQKKVSESLYSHRIQENYQIEPFQIQSQSLTHPIIEEMIESWNVLSKISEKFNFWYLNFHYNKIIKSASQSFYKTAIHYVFLKKFPSLIKNFDLQKVLIQSRRLKQIYKALLLKGKLKERKFDQLILVAVKLTGFFLGSHTRQIIINRKLESQIFIILVYGILGIEVGERCFDVLIKKYMKKSSSKYNRNSDTQKLTLIDDMKSKKSSEDNEIKIKSTAVSRKRIGRTQCRTGSELFQKPPDHVEDFYFREMKYLLKTNLMVKEFVPKPRPKQTLDQVLCKSVNIETKLRQLKQVKQLENTMMKLKKIQYTQMSSSMDLKRDNQSLNMLYNHSLLIRQQKKSVHYKMLKQSDLGISSKQKQPQKIKLPQIQKPLKQKKLEGMAIKMKEPNYWQKVFVQIKKSKKLKIQHFPSISPKINFRLSQINDKNQRIPVNIDTNQKQNIPQDNTQVPQYITQKVMSMPVTTKLIQNTQYPIFHPKNTPQKTFKNLSNNTKNILQEVNEQINTIEHQKISNQSEVYKYTKGFLNIYSNMPLNETILDLKEKPNLIRELKKKFDDECKKRNDKIQKCYFS